ncbi:MAG: error-prone DNA polymerase, partial [Rhizobiaceae bacterium]|nr:error-prone DNA polymerase [Rhizobiaceae bacterium]
GFPESHAASFALLVYVSCWLKCHYPDVFCAAILNAQPMGFYAPGQLIRDAREHGVEVRPVDVNFSGWDASLEPDATPQPIKPQHGAMAGVMKNTHAVRLGLLQVKGFGEAEAEQLVAKRGDGYDSVRDLWMRSGLTRRAIEKLAEADCFSSLGLSRRDALWAVKALDPLSSAERLPLFAAANTANLQREPDIALPPMPLGEEVVNDYQSLAFSLKAHPVAFLREQLDRARCLKAVELQNVRSGAWVKVAGLVLVRQRPGSAKGVIFETIEDETGIANLIVWPKTFEKYRAVVLGSRCVGVRGRLQNEEGVIHVVADHLADLSPLLSALTSFEGEIGGLANADEVKRPVEDIRRKIKPASRLARLLKDSPQLRQDLEELGRLEAAARAMPKGRNFH